MGAAGSLIFGAVGLFVVASAVVAFDGWPQMGAMASPAIQRVPGDSAGGGSLRAAHAVTVSVAAPAPARSLRRPVRAPGTTRVNGARPVTGGGTAAAGGPTGPGTRAPVRDCTGGCGGIIGSGGSGSGGAAGGVAGQLGGVAGQVAGAAGQVGTAAGSAVSTVTHQAATTVSGIGAAAGSAVSHALGATPGSGTAGRSEG